jgi:hypothetical protein
LNAIVVTNLKIHDALFQLLADLDNRLLRVPQHAIVTNDCDTPTFVTIQLRIFPVKPLPFGDSLVGTATELHGQFPSKEAIPAATNI